MGRMVGLSGQKINEGKASRLSAHNEKSKVKETSIISHHNTYCLRYLWYSVAKAGT